MKKIFSILIGINAFVLLANPALAAPTIIYNSLPSISPETSYPSQPFQAQATSEFGDSIRIAGTNRILNDVTVTMVTWARFSEYSSNSNYQGNNINWSYPITLNVYSSHLNSDGIPDELLAGVTQDIVIPWRPESDPTCPDSGYGLGFAWRDSSNVCRNGLAFNATFDLSNLMVTIPDDIIVTVAFNTQTWGHSPTGVTGPYNSLNVAVPPLQSVVVGSDSNTDAVYWNSTYAGRAAGLKIDTNWTPYGTVPLRITASAPVIPNSQKANIYHVNNCNSDQVGNDLYQGHVTLVTPDGKNDLMLQGVIQGLSANTEYTVWVRDLNGYEGPNINSYIPLGYFALTSFNTNKKGMGNFSYKINKTDLPAGMYSIQVALNTDTQKTPRQLYGCTKAATTNSFLKVFVGQ